MSVVIETTIGDITVDLFIEERQLACLNFLKLCKLKYYNFNLFHTVQQGFIAQTGDPTGTGGGGGSVWNVLESTEKRFFKAESLPKIYHSTSGLLSLVGVSKYLVGSQFFFTLGENLLSLDGQHCVIGEVVEGHEVLRKLNEAIVDEKFRPYQDIRITHTVILDDPFPDPNNLREPNISPPPTAERLKNGRIAADEDINDTVGKTPEEIQEMLAEREAKARATILEIVGDIPNAEIAPPENVLFVCKLNPVTTEDDLEIIFSRFGVVKSCEVIRDKKSGDSLQYAFVEFENKKACERAYFKMDNVLIDDRRIHVDFSQSVAKIKWFGKGRRLEGYRNCLDFNNLRGNGNSQQRGKVEVKKKQSKHHEKIKEHFTRDKPYRIQERTCHSTSTSRSSDSRYEGNEIFCPASSTKSRMSYNKCVDSNIERRIKKERDSAIEQKRRKNSKRTKTPNNTSESESSNNQEYGVSSSHNSSPNAKRHKKKHSKRSRKEEIKIRSKIMNTTY